VKTAAIENQSEPRRQAGASQAGNIGVEPIDRYATCSGSVARPLQCPLDVIDGDHLPASGGEKHGMCAGPAAQIKCPIRARAKDGLIAGISILAKCRARTALTATTPAGATTRVEIASR
jgi:hypothetical protein